MQNLIIKITQENTKLTANPKIGCFILSENLSPRFIDEFTSKAHEQSKLVLSSGDNALETYKKHHTDGLILDASKEEKPQNLIKQIKLQAKDAILGVITRNRRHEAMLISECEPDFIIFRFWQDGFSENIELLNWYNDLFLIQNAAFPQEKLDYSLIKSDFLILDDTQI